MCRQEDEPVLETTPSLLRAVKSKSVLEGKLRLEIESARGSKAL